MPDGPIDDIDIVEQMSQQQPTRTGKTRPPRRFDKTQLKSNHHGRYVHRDYAAHFFRWGWVSRHVKRGARILEVGCGQELPLMHVLSGNMSCIPTEYVGYDLNKIDLDAHSVPKWALVSGEFDFVSNWKDIDLDHDGYDVGINFEVIEHMQPVDGKRLLEGFRHLLRPGGKLFLSTPVFDGKAAVNHVHEYTISELQELIESVGFKVDARYGTFASARDIKAAAAVSPNHLVTYQELEDYYGGDVMATFLAPLYPDASRNNLWVLENAK